VRTVVYQSTKGLRLDYFSPPGTASLPGVVLFAGGGFEGTSRSDMHPFAEDLVRRGYVTACADYTVTGDPRDALPDAIDAVSWLRSRSRCNGRIGALGSSAGGVLAIGLAILSTVLAASSWSGSAGIPVPSLGPRVRPLLDVHGTHDHVVPFDQATQLKRAYRTAKGTMTLQPRSTSAHGLKLVARYPGARTAAYDHLDAYLL
jgi:acetyl esterase/lipase